MRIYRILTAAIAFALLGLTPVALTPAATAAVAADADRATHTAKRLPRREMHDKVVKVGNKLIFKGRVDPGHGPVFIEKKNCRKGCPWHRFAKVSTDADSRWRVRIYAPRRGAWFWRGYVKAYGGYAKSKTSIWRTYTI